MSGRKCPHGNKIYCPLYRASHECDVAKYSCDDGKLDTGQCAVGRGMSYDKAIAHLNVLRADIVATCRFQETAAEDRAQHLRNLRAAGLLN